MKPAARGGHVHFRRPLFHFPQGSIHRLDQIFSLEIRLSHSVIFPLG
jgi:hypothetical protein